jgi:hypothetical protein
MVRFAMILREQMLEGDHPHNRLTTRQRQREATIGMVAIAGGEPAAKSANSILGNRLSKNRQTMFIIARRSIVW